MYQPFQIKNKEVLEQHVLDCFPNEACGFLIDNKFVPVENVHEEPNMDFRIASKEMKKAYKKGLQAIIHSHTCPLDDHPFNRFGHKFDIRTPSMKDMESQEATNVPWGITSTEGENVTELVWFGLDHAQPLMEWDGIKTITSLENRPYIPNIYDCYTLGRDYYMERHGIKTRNTPRPPHWESYDPKIYENGYEEQGFIKIPKQAFDLKYDKLRISDVLMICHGQPDIVNHIGVYVGDGEMLTHFGSIDRLPEKRKVGVWWTHCKFVIRHKDLIDDESLIE